MLGEVSKARSEARNLRDRLKEAEPKLTEWQALQEASKSELEKAQEAAKSAVDRIASMQQSVAAAKIEAALTGVIPDVAAVIEDLNIAKFLDAEGNVDASKVDALRTKFATFATPANPGMKPNPAQGRSASPAPSTHDLIAQAQAAGDMKTAIRLKSQLALEASEK
ncbi:MAG: hypothetical protein ACRDRL_29005 [Sciscionella sp.]